MQCFASLDPCNPQTSRRRQSHWRPRHFEEPQDEDDIQQGMQQAPGTALLYGAFAIHSVLALWSVYRRRTFRLPPLELLRIALASRCRSF